MGTNKDRMNFYELSGTEQADEGRNIILVMLKYISAFTGSFLVLHALPKSPILAAFGALLVALSWFLNRFAQTLRTKPDA